jgi:hypothetical protein
VERPGRGDPAGGAPKRRRGGKAQSRPARMERGAFYAALFTADELADLAKVESDLSLEEEIGLLRVAIRRAFAEGESLETVSRSVQRLAQALKTERQLQGQGIRNLEEALARVLDELGAEIGKT